MQIKCVCTEGVEMIALSRTLLPSSGADERLRSELEIKRTYFVFDKIFSLYLYTLDKKVPQYFNLIAFCHNSLKGQTCQCQCKTSYQTSKLASDLVFPKRISQVNVVAH